MLVQLRRSLERMLHIASISDGADTGATLHFLRSSPACLGGDFADAGGDDLFELSYIPSAVLLNQTLDMSPKEET